MLDPKSRAGPQLQKEFPSALCSHCLCHLLNLSVASVNSVPRSMKDMIHACLEIVRLLKFSPKRERFLGENFFNMCVFQ